VTEIWLLVFIVIVGMVVAIEGIPEGFNKKAKTFVAELAATAERLIRRIAGVLMIVAKGIGHQIQQSRSLPDQSTERTSPVPRLRVAIGTAVAVVSSPFAAIPMNILFALLLYALNVIGGDDYSLVADTSGTLRYILGYAFVILVATLDVISRWSVVALPMLLVLGFIAATYASRSNRFSRTLALSTLTIGAVYPMVFMLAAALNVFNEPVFN
jgi:uncharacterized protein YjeT (DUF2065 family)